MENYKTSETKLTTTFKEICYFEDDRLSGYECVNCGHTFTTYWIKGYKFCNRCGARNTDYKEV